MPENMINITAVKRILRRVALKNQCIIVLENNLQDNSDPVLNTTIHAIKKSLAKTTRLRFAYNL